MISAWWLFLIIPISVSMGMVLAGLFNSTDERQYDLQAMREEMKSMEHHPGDRMD